MKSFSKVSRMSLIFIKTSIECNTLDIISVLCILKLGEILNLPEILNSRSSVDFALLCDMIKTLSKHSSNKVGQIYFCGTCDHI